MNEKKPKSSVSQKFPLVGLGASAGGLEALFRFFESMPPQPGMTFIVVQHLSPDQDSLLPELLQKHTPLNVLEIQEQMRIEKEKLYVLPPGYELSIQKARFHLSKRSKSKGWPQGINRFFESLAEEWGQGAAAIILSGQGTMAQMARGESANIKDWSSPRIWRAPRMRVCLAV